MKKLLRFIPAGSVVLGLTTLLSYGVGFYRDRIFAITFGATRALDAYNAAFLLPDLLFNILIASGIAAAFVPILTELLKSDRKRATEYANTMLTGATAVMILASGVMVIFANTIGAWVAPGFSPHDQLLVAQLIRCLSLSPIIFGISNALGAILTVERRFLYYGLSPVLYNGGIVLGTIFLVPHFGIVGVAIGTMFGALLHMLIRLADVLYSGFKLRFGFKWSAPEFRKSIRLMIPKMFGHPVELATFWAFTVIASRLQPGSVAIMNFARNFESVPVSLIGITVATTTFPLLARAITDHSLKQFKKILARSFWIILGGSVLSAIALFLIREPLIRIAFSGGAFTHASIVRTALTLGMFTLAIPMESLVQLMARAFYATKNTLIPVIFSVINFIVSTGMALYLVPRLDITALPLAFFFGSGTELILLLIFIPWRLRSVVRDTSYSFDPHIEGL